MSRYRASKAGKRHINKVNHAHKSKEELQIYVKQQNRRINTLETWKKRATARLKVWITYGYYFCYLH